MKNATEILRAKFEGTRAAISGRKIDANPYDENDDLHFTWLAAWTDVKMERLAHDIESESIV